MCERIDCDKVEVHRGNDGKIRNAVRDLVLKISDGRAVTLGNHIYLPDGTTSTATLAHELTHTGQFQRDRAPGYYVDAAFERLDEGLNRLRLGPSPYEIPNPLRANYSFSLYGMEQQAVIVQQCFLGRPDACGVSPYGPGR